MTSGVPGAIRTHDLRLRRALLYPAELPEHLRRIISPFRKKHKEKNTAGHKNNAEKNLYKRQTVYLRTIISQFPNPHFQRLGHLQIPPNLY